MYKKMRLVDANELIQKHGSDITNWDKPCAVYISSIENAPTVDAEPVVHGKWVDRYGAKHAYPVFECSVCKEAALLGFGYEHITQALSAYCPCCGAKMDLED